jgi:hypothetical protein
LAMTTKRVEKRLILINRDFQLRYVGAAVGLGIVTSLLSAVLILYPLFQFEILRIPRFLPWPILAMMIFAAILNVAVIAIVGLYITHRIAGPMFALARAFRRVESGGWRTELRVRSGDDLLYLVRNFNEMVSGIAQLASHDADELCEIAQGCQDESLKLKLLKMESQIRSRLQLPATTAQRGDV